MEATEEALDERVDKSVPTEYIMKMLEVILKYNLFEFNQEQYIQKIGTAMGSVPAVSYANIFMAKKIDPKILALAEKYQTEGESALQFFRRFLDDCKLVWRGTAAKLHEFFTELNTLHPTLKFTMEHTASKHPDDECDCPHVTSVPFLDTSCSNVNGKIITDLFRKETDRNQYLLPSSCHPNHVTNNIPFSLALRIVRICTTPESREKRFEELKGINFTQFLQNKKDSEEIIIVKQHFESVAQHFQSVALHFEQHFESVEQHFKQHFGSVTQHFESVAQHFQQHF